jgi:ATP-dependent Clp endopeptidase proteolytic subunit ClpP
MPYSNEHSCRLKDPGQYARVTRVNCQQKHDDKCIDVIFGWKKKEGEEISEIQALRYDKELWTETSARSHCKSRGGTFEPASSEDGKAVEDQKFQCECIDCGYEMESEKHCRDLKCPKCGGAMRRKDRPGPGQKNKGDLKMKWYEIKAKKEGPAEIWIYDEIGLWGISAKEFVIELNALENSKIDMHINSPGGEVFDGAAIYNAVKRHPAEVTTYIDGIAASIASVIALAGKKVVMAENAIFMMHNPSGLVIGTAEDMRKLADILDKIRETMIGAYITKSGKSDSEIKALLDAETWMDADETKAAGFADEIGAEMDLAACVKFVPSMQKMGFRHIPRDLNALKKMPSERDLERTLRDAGCSSKEAKSILAKGYETHLRDAGPAPPEPPNAQAPPRDAGQPKPTKKDRVADLLTRAELVAPSP